MILPITLDSKFKTAMFFQYARRFLLFLFFEVFEEKKVRMVEMAQSPVEGELPDDPTKELTKGLAPTELRDLYEYEYDPEVAEYPREPKYIDEVDGSGDPTLAGGGGEIDEPSEQAKFDEEVETAAQGSPSHLWRMQRPKRRGWATRKACM